MLSSVQRGVLHWSASGCLNGRRRDHFFQRLRRSFCFSFSEVFWWPCAFHDSQLWADLNADHQIFMHIPPEMAWLWLTPQQIRGVFPHFLKLLMQGVVGLEKFRLCFVFLTSLLQLKYKILSEAFRIPSRNAMCWSACVGWLPLQYFASMPTKCRDR